MFMADVRTAYDVDHALHCLGQLSSIKFHQGPLTILNK